MHEGLKEAENLKNAFALLDMSYRVIFVVFALADCLTLITLSYVINLTAGVSKLINPLDQTVNNNY